MADPHPIRTFSLHCRQRFGCAVGKIPLDVGAICPNRATGGCIFCRPRSFTPQYLMEGGDIASQIVRGKEQLLAGRFQKYFAYFQQETCTVLPVEEFLPLCEIPLRDPDCMGLIISTRPDYVQHELVSALAELLTTHGKRCLFELGLQSVHDSSLVILNRNHHYDDFIGSGLLIKQYECFELSAHLILGIPGESRADMLHSLQAVCIFGVDALKLHHLQVVKETPLAQMYYNGRIEVFTLKEYLQLLVDFIPRIPANVTLHRLWTTSHPDLLIAPKWNILAGKLSNMLQSRLQQQNLWQGKYYVEEV